MNTPPKTRDRKKGDPDYSSQPENPGGREGSDDSLVESSPTDSRSDEKVVINEQRANKTVNAPSQTAANTNEGSSNDEEILD